ncbi:MAG TPA: hypothetical protein P5096_02995 [Patescibacteria group bacterium]|nr:hypothetical protein [Patescibacteria group bacterium]
MRLNNFLWIFEILTCVFWVVFLSILFFINPYNAKAEIFILFFISLLIALAGTWTITEFRLVTKYRGMDALNRKLSNSFRHGFMTSLVISGLLFMQGLRVLKVWDAVMFVLAIALFEAYFLTRGNFMSGENK